MQSSGYAPESGCVNFSSFNQVNEKDSMCEYGLQRHAVRSKDILTPRSGVHFFEVTVQDFGYENDKRVPAQGETFGSLIESGFLPFVRVVKASVLQSSYHSGYRLESDGSEMRSSAELDTVGNGGA
jgi:hypothetical protein